MEKLLVIKKIQRVYDCKYCSKPVANRSSHEQVHFYCPLCKTKFNNKENFIKNNCKFKKICYVLLNMPD